MLARASDNRLTAKEWKKQKPSAGEPTTCFGVEFFLFSTFWRAETGDGFFFPSTGTRIQIPPPVRTIFLNFFCDVRTSFFSMQKKIKYIQLQYIQLKFFFGFFFSFQKELIAGKSRTKKMFLLPLTLSVSRVSHLLILR